LKTKELRFWRVQKSLQGIEKAEDRTKNVGMFEGLNVETLKRKRLTVEGRKARKGSEGVPIR
jgi:hypothetical protein